MRRKQTHNDMAYNRNMKYAMAPLLQQCALQATSKPFASSHTFEAVKLVDCQSQTRPTASPWAPLLEFLEFSHYLDGNFYDVKQIGPTSIRGWA